MSYIWEWSSHWLTSFLNYFNSFFKKPVKILFIGLENAGKTTLINMIKTNEFGQRSPTQQTLSKEELQLGNITVTAYDFRGHVQARKIWKNYFLIADAIIFMIDASDEERFDEARDELFNVLEDDEISDIPILILGNKIDIASAVDEKTLKERLGLGNIGTARKENNSDDTDNRIRPMKICMCSVVCRRGYGEGFRWLSTFFN